jgi:hypothetical protein
VRTKNVEGIRRARTHEHHSSKDARPADLDGSRRFTVGEGEFYRGATLDKAELVIGIGVLIEDKLGLHVVIRTLKANGGVLNPL